MPQIDKAEKKAKASRNSAPGWNRDRMTKTHRKGKKKAKSVASSARRNLNKALVRGAFEVPPSVSTGIEEPDYERCQTDITEGVSAQNFMTMGGRIGKTKRCDEKPTTVVTEREPGEDGKIGRMAVCDSCCTVLFQKMGNKVIYQRIAELLPLAEAQKKWDALDGRTRTIFVAHGLRRPTA